MDKIYIRPFSMKLRFSRNKIEFEKKLNKLDFFVFDFVKMLDKTKVKYVLVSGYVSILFGRSRLSEDIDVIVEKMNIIKFKKFWKEITKSFECVNTKNAEDAYKRYY